MRAAPAVTDAAELTEWRWQRSEARVAEGTSGERTRKSRWKVPGLLAARGMGWLLRWGNACLLPSSGGLAPFHLKQEAQKEFPFRGNSS